MTFLYRRWKLVVACCAWVSVLLASFSVFLGRDAWLLDLPTFGWPYLVAAMIVLVLVALTARRLFVIAPSMLAFSIACIPLFSIPTAPRGTGCTLRLVTANLFVENERGPNDFLAFIAAQQPDILVTQETRPEWESAIREAGLFSFESSSDMPERDDMKVFSRLPIVNDRSLGVHRIGMWDRFPVRLELQYGRSTLVLYAMHPHTPRSRWQWNARSSYLDQAARAIAADVGKAPVIAVGDWNTPTYSPYFRDFLNSSHLFSVGDGYPWDVTRFTMKLAPFLHIGSTIDHVAVSSRFSVVRRSIGPDFGSNHSPVVVDLGESGPDNPVVQADAPRCGQAVSLSAIRSKL